MIRVEPLSGPDLTRHLDGLAALRIRVFRDYPYLYDGDPAYEAWYLEDFAKAEGAVVIAALDGDRLVGAATASPMRAQKEEFRAPLGDLADRLFYFGESVLLPEYRGQGLGHRFFDAREAAARDQGYALTGFYSVVRPADNPLKPRDYSPLWSFWQKRGYAPLANVEAQFPWKEIGQAEETAHPMQFWLRGSA